MSRRIRLPRRWDAVARSPEFGWVQSPMPTAVAAALTTLVLGLTAGADTTRTPGDSGRTRGRSGRSTPLEIEGQGFGVRRGGAVDREIEEAERARGRRSPRRRVASRSDSTSRRALSELTFEPPARRAAERCCVARARASEAGRRRSRRNEQALERGETAWRTTGEPPCRRLSRHHARQRISCRRAARRR